MKMPRSQCESENIQFVQELAEVDGPFESPININFRDLTKLELPSLVWNRGDTCPKKMKITNTGHTVILSGKWKCERPYLTGGPLSGKYVFSQIHFHWGQDDCKGSEHQVCGDGFPLEMHVAHFKTEYLTQENALREKDGMVIVVYLFKLQDEPNQSLKKIISLLQCVQQPSTSHSIDPRPILSFCNPFTDDYFMYWGSVVTTTCAHILLWLICREPFGISKDQVCEFRKIMDSSQQPISRNCRDIQPLHKRNVFHVNASKHLDDPLLPVKKILGCYCKESGETDTANVQNSQECKCQTPMLNQEECEGGIAEYMSGNSGPHAGGMERKHLGAGVQRGCFHQNQTYFVQRATVHSVSVLVKRFGSEPVGNHHQPEKPRQHRVEEKLPSKSCCFLPPNDCSRIKTEKRKVRGKKAFNSNRAFSQILQSLEALKNHTIKKLREIESINQEIKGMKSYCQWYEDKTWLRKIEKMMKREKRATIKSSQGCLTELKKLAKDCNLDRIFDFKSLAVNENNGKLYNKTYNVEITKENLCSPEALAENGESPKKDASKTITAGKATKISAKAQKLIQSFFEDIQDTDELHQTVKKDLKKMKSICSKQAGDSNSVLSVMKGFITPSMFVSGNLEDRFFTEVTTDFENDESPWDKIKEGENLIMRKKTIEEETLYYYKDEKGDFETNVDERPKPRGRKSIGSTYSNVEIPISNLEVLSYAKSTVTNKEKQKKSERFSRDSPKKSSAAPSLILQQTVESNYEDEEEYWHTQTIDDVHRSSSNLSTDSTDIRRMIMDEISRRRSRKDFWEQNSSDPCGMSYVSPYEKSSCKEFGGYYINKRNQKTKRRRKHKGERLRVSGSSSREASKMTAGKWKSLTKAKFRLEIEKTSESLVDLAFDHSILSPKRKKLKLESGRGSKHSLKENSQKYWVERESDMAVLAGLEGHQVSKAAEKRSPKDRNVAEHTRVVSSVNSKTSYAKKKEVNEDSYRAFENGNNNLNAEFFKHVDSKFKVRSKSLACLPTEPRTSTEVAQRLYLESLYDRRKNKTEVSNLRRPIESPNKREDTTKPKKDLSCEVLTEIYDSNGEKKQQKTSEDSSRKQEYNVQFFTTASSQMDEELVPKSPEAKFKNPVLKRCDAEKYQFLEKQHLELSPTFQERKEDYHEILHPTDSSKSFTKDASKGDSKLQSIGNKDLQTSISYQRLKTTSPSRPHSAETLNSLTKTFKRKGKKRPHCCKRVSRHYIRKNSSIIKKPPKTESKQLNFLSLTDQEQLKIITVNIMKYLKQKLTEENKGLNPGELSMDNIEEAVFTKLKATQQSKEDNPPKEPNAIKDEKPKQNKIPIMKGKDKNKGKVTQSENKTKTKPLQSPTEAKTEKQVSALPKPANNFIKLNKRMAGQFKKRTPTPEKKLEPKVKQKLKPRPEKTTKEGMTAKEETTNKEETPKFRTRIPKKLAEKNVAPKSPEQPKARPETPSTPGSQKQSPTRKVNNETRIKSPAASTKKVVKKREQKMAKQSPAEDVSPTPNDSPSNAVEESKELMPCEQNTTETALAPITVHIAPEEKTKHFVPAYTLTSYLPAPIEIMENQTRKVNRYLLGVGKADSENYLPDVRYDNNNSKKVLDGNDMFKKELEYFIKLEMLDFSANMEKTINYARPTISQDFFGVNCLENTPVDDPIDLDPCNKEIVLLKMKDVECTSSASDFAEDTDILGRDLMDRRNLCFDKDRDIITVNIPEESADPDIMSPPVVCERPTIVCERPTIVCERPTMVCERPDEANSDSSYDCKISITLNTNFNVESEENLADGAAQNLEKDDCEVPGSEVYGCQVANVNRDLDDSSSQSLIVKPCRRKRKDNEISLEMKRKLLEILEWEIRREAGRKDQSSENSSEGFPFKWDGSDRNVRSQSTVSSCENIEVLTQISDTMRQYLQGLKEKGQLVEILNESSDKESK